MNLQIEHKLDCHGHLIEAGVSHYQATGQGTLLEIACRAADLYDPTRLVDHASGWIDQGGGDMRSLHVYFK